MTKCGHQAYEMRARWSEAEQESEWACVRERERRGVDEVVSERRADEGGIKGPYRVRRTDTIRTIHCARTQAYKMSARPQQGEIQGMRTLFWRVLM
eukprot:768143-Pleurochrysis_carterae.AAC.2